MIEKQFYCVAGGLGESADTEEVKAFCPGISSTSYAPRADSQDKKLESSSRGEASPRVSLPLRQRKAFLLFLFKNKEKKGF